MLWAWLRLKKKKVPKGEDVEIKKKAPPEGEAKKQNEMQGYPGINLMETQI